MAKKRKKKLPLGPADQSGSQKKMVAKTLNEWKHGTVVENDFGYWKEYLEWFYGNQYVYYNKDSGVVEDVSPLVDREVKNVYNRILPMVRSMWGDLRYPHSFYVEPNTTERDDIKASKLGSSVIEYTNIRQGFRHKINQGKLEGIIIGHFFWKEWWNTELPATIEDPKDKGRGMTVKEAGHKGDCDYDWISPFNIRVDPLATLTKRAEWRYVLEGKRVPKATVEDEFELKRGTLPAEETDTEAGLLGREGDIPAEETVVRIERWERPSKDHPSGRFMVMTSSGWLLHSSSNPAPDHDLPYFLIPGVLPKVGKPGYDSAVRIGQASQRRLNRYGSLVDEHIENYKAKALVAQDSLDLSEQKKYTRSGIDYIFYRPGFQPPYWQAPPPLPEFLMGWTAFQENNFEEETSVRKVSKAQLPKHATRASGVLWEGLKSQDEKVLLPTIEDQDVALEKAMKFRLKLVKKHYTIPRMVKVTGKNKATSVIFLKGTELRDNTDIRVKAGVDIFTQRREKREIVNTLIEKGLITEPRQAFELLEYKGLDEFMEDEFIDERQAQRENEMLKAGKITPVASEDDNHQVHYQVHNNERKTEGFALWKDEAKENHHVHKKQHKVFMAASLQKVQAINQPQGEEGAPPEAEQGPDAAIAAALSNIQGG